MLALESKEATQSYVYGVQQGAQNAALGFFFSGVKDASGRGVSTHPQNRESAKQEVKDPHAQWGVLSQVLEFVMSLGGTMVWNGKQTVIA